jgi:tetraprenyl-beta-curcumene synthase
MAFVTAARRYWLAVFPRIYHERRYWRKRAEQIPDPQLRRLALEAQRAKRGNVEGAAAFAAFAPRGHRAAVVQAQVAFQSVYDYVDTLSEQPSDDPIANGLQLHGALLAALRPGSPQPQYYARYGRADDGGYLQEIVEACRSALATLPSSVVVEAAARRTTERIVAYQGLNLSERHGGHRELADWASRATPAGTTLRWWETAASAGSSLGLFALLAAAARPTLAPKHAAAIEAAYWPWIGALHSLLDSLIDYREDAAAGQRSLLDYYDNPREMAARLGLLATEALRAAVSLPTPSEHCLVLTGMVSYYLTAPEANNARAVQAAQIVTDALGTLIKPAMLVLRVRRTVRRAMPPWSETSSTA